MRIQYFPKWISLTVATSIYSTSSCKDIKFSGKFSTEQSSFRYRSTSNITIHPRSRTSLPWLQIVLPLHTSKLRFPDHPLSHQYRASNNLQHYDVARIYAQPSLHH